MAKTSATPATWKQYREYIGECFSGPEVLGKSIVTGALSLMTLSTAVIAVAAVPLAFITPFPLISVGLIATTIGSGYATTKLYKATKKTWGDLKGIKESLWNKVMKSSKSKSNAGSLSKPKREKHVDLKKEAKPLAKEFSKNQSTERNKTAGNKAKTTPQNKPKI